MSSTHDTIGEKEALATQEHRIRTLVAKYRDGRDDARALEAAAHDILAILEVLDSASRAASAGLDRGSLHETVKTLYATFELPRE